MSEIDLDNEDIIENPTPEEDSDLVQGNGSSHGCLVTDQPEDDFCSQEDGQLSSGSTGQPSLDGIETGPEARTSNEASPRRDLNSGTAINLRCLEGKLVEDVEGACGGQGNGERDWKGEDCKELGQKQEAKGASGIVSSDVEPWQSSGDLNDQPEDDSNNALCTPASDSREEGRNAVDSAADLPEDELTEGIRENVADRNNTESALNPGDSPNQPPSSVSSPNDASCSGAPEAYAPEVSSNHAATLMNNAGEDMMVSNESGLHCYKTEFSFGEHPVESEASGNVSDRTSADTSSAVSDSRKNNCQAPECDQSFQTGNPENVSVSSTPQINHEESNEENILSNGPSAGGKDVAESIEVGSHDGTAKIPLAGRDPDAGVEPREDAQGTAASSSLKDSALPCVQESSSDSPPTAGSGELPQSPLGLCNSRGAPEDGVNPQEELDTPSAVEAIMQMEADLGSAMSSLSPSSSENSTPNPASSPVKSALPPHPSPPTQPPPRPPPPPTSRPGPSPSTASVRQSSSSASQESLSRSTTNSNFEDDLLSELDAELALPEGRLGQAVVRSPPAGLALNGLKQADLSSIPGVAELQQQLSAAQRHLQEKDEELQRLQEERKEQQEDLAAVTKEKEHYLAQLQAARSKVNSDDLYLPQIKELEYTIAKQQNEIRALKDKLASHDTAAKRAVATLQNELKLRIDQVTKMYDDCLKEKDAMVVRFAEAEQKNIEAKRHSERLEAKLREMAKEKESLLAKMRAAAADRQKAVTDLEAKTSELGAILRETEKLKDAASSAEYRIKWFQNKLKAELEAHKETKATLEKTNVKLKESREENAQIRRDCQAMIKVYQESEELKSNSLDKELRVKETLLQQQRQEKNDQTEVHQMTLKELEALKAQHKDHIEELKTLRDKVKCLEDERLQNEETMAKFKEIIQKQKNENHELQSRIAVMSQLQDECSRTRDMVSGLDRELEELRVLNKDLQTDMESCRRRESELLHLTEKLSNKNATLQSENTNLHNQVASLSAENTNFRMEVEEIEANAKDLEEKLATEQRLRSEETAELKSELAAKTKECKELQQQLEDEQDANRVLKRKHASNVKDLARQLQQAKRRLEAYENQGGDRETTSMGSRTSSNNSLHTLDSQLSQHHHHHHHHHPSRQPSQEQEHASPEQVEVDRQVLIERIVKLQRAHARKNEKLDFLEDHIRQLVDQLQKKNRIIQNYALREEAGTLAPEFMDEHKALLAKKGGIMASVYSVHQQDGHMTMDLSLEINKKLQAVLEDTLLKNMTLKESLDTLGEEISRLSQENRQLQLRLQRQAKS